MRERTKHIVLYLLAAAIFLLANRPYVGGLRAKSAQDQLALPVALTESNAKSGAKEDVRVEIYGAVQKTGSFTLPAGSRLADILWLCGVVRDADLTQFSMAHFLANGDRIYVPFMDADKNKEMAASGPWSDYSPTVTAPEKAAAEQTEQSKLLDLNTATLEQLIALPGIGAVKAQNILTYRGRVGRFRSVNELTAVSGIGAKTMEQLRPYVTVNDS